MSTKVEQAITAIKAGDKEAGRHLLTQILQADPRNETAWLWLAYVVESDKQRRECLERVIAINPAHKQARRGLAALNGHSPSPAHPATSSETPVKAAPAADPALPPGAEVKEPVPQAEEKAKGRDYLGWPWTLALLLITVGLIMGMQLIERWASWASLAQSGVTTLATLVDARVGPNGNYYITYSFEAPTARGDLTRLEKEEQVSEEIYHLLQPGSTVKVQYLFENPAVVRRGGSDSLGNLVVWSVVALLTGTLGLTGTIKNIGWSIKQGRSLFKKTPPKPKVVWEGEGPPPLKQWTDTFTLGQDNYEGFFVIETEDGIFLGEGGMEILKSIPDTSPKQPIAFDVGFFDKTDITTRSSVVMSEYAYHDETIRAAVEVNPAAQVILAKPGAEFTLESAAMRIEAKIDEMEYGEGGQVYFQKLTVSLSIFVKEGIDLAQPMEVPEQFK